MKHKCKFLIVSILFLLHSADGICLAYDKKSNSTIMIEAQRCEKLNNELSITKIGYFDDSVRQVVSKLETQEIKEMNLRVLSDSRIICGPIQPIKVRETTEEERKSKANSAAFQFQKLKLEILAAYERNDETREDALRQSIKEICAEQNLEMLFEQSRITHGLEKLYSSSPNLSKKIIAKIEKIWAQKNSTDQAQKEEQLAR